MSKSDTVQYRNWATPKGAIALLKLLYEGKVLSAQSRELLTKLMIETPTGPRRIKGLLPRGTIVAHKTGTSSTVNGITAATNGIGIISLAINISRCPCSCRMQRRILKRARA